MIYAIVYSVTFPITDDSRSSEDISREFSLKLEKHDLFSKENKCQTQDDCWFVKSDLTANEIHKALDPNKNINIIVSRINSDISGFTSLRFWKWIQTVDGEEMSDPPYNLKDENPSNTPD